MNRVLVLLLFTFWAVFASPINPKVKREPVPVPVAAPAPAPADKTPDVSEVKSADASVTKTGDKSSKTDIPDVSEYHSGDSSSEDKKKKTSDKSDDKKKDSSKTESDDDKKKDKKTSKTKETKTTPTSIDPRLGAGQISMVTPASTSTTYVKIGQKATFSWKYQSLIITPDKLNILATAASNTQQTLTLATNHPSDDTKFVWDTKKTDSQPNVELLTAKYSILMFDSKGNMSMAATAGRLAPLTYELGLYRGQKYTPEPEDATYTNGGALTDTTVLKWVVGLSAVVMASGLQVILS